MTFTQQHLVNRQTAVLNLYAAANDVPQRDQFGSYAEWQQAFENFQTETMEPLRQEIREARLHVWDHRGYCEICGEAQPDYEPGDANMPNLAVNTDIPDSTTYPWN